MRSTVFIAGSLLAASLIFGARVAEFASARPAGAMPQGKVAVAKPPGDNLYQQNCAKCHSNPSSSNRAPSLTALMKFSPETIYGAITTGLMASAAQNLSDSDKRLLASYLGGRPLDLSDAGSARNMTNHCETSAAPFENISATPAWNGWGANLSNTRFQDAQAAGLTAQQVSTLQLKWAFGFPNGDTSFGQPSIVGGRVFVGSDIGYFYSLNADTGCIYWSYRAQATVRTAATVGPVTGSGATKYAVYFGDFRGNVYALDAATGKPLWIKNVIDNYLARLSAGPTLYQGRLYVPISSTEEVFAADESYSCCKFRGSIVTLNANTGQLIWKSYVIPEAPKPIRRNSRGTQLYAPAGGAVWNSPTIDTVRNLLYIGTGDAYTEPTPKTTDAVLALDLATGKIVWSFQAVKADSWIVGCVPARTDNCPKDLGPDHDIGASPILVNLPDGHRLLIALPKSGTVFALDPDREGALVWKLATINIVAPNNGQVALGGATDERNLYLALEDGTAIAIDLASGKRAWLARLESLSDLGEPTSNGENRTKAGLRFGQSAAITAIQGVIFTGGWDGILRGLSAADGQVIWQFNMAREFKTVNGVAAGGGSMGGPGPTVANGTLYVPSGYAAFGGGLPGNVLLALSPAQ